MTGVWRTAPSGAIPMVSIFGDNRVAENHPDWVQVGPDGERATLESRYFDWDAICPSRDEVFQQGLNWVTTAHQESGHSVLRLDDVAYAREEFCQCPVCRERAQKTGLSFQQMRMERITEFVAQAHRIVPHLQMTVFPDPLPGHLERRFGIDPVRLAPYIETFVVPIYDMHYATTYWLEILAQGFRELFSVPWLIELYGLQVPEAALLHACQVAQGYADGVIVAYDNQLQKLQRIQERLAHDAD